MVSADMSRASKKQSQKPTRQADMLGTPIRIRIYRPGHPHSVRLCHLPTHRRRKSIEYEENSKIWLTQSLVARLNVETSGRKRERKQISRFARDDKTRSALCLLVASRLKLPILWLRIGAALERWAIIVGAVGIVARGLLFGLFSFGTQRRLAGGVIADFAREHDVAKAGLHGIKFGSGNDVFLPGGQNARDFFLRVFDALGRRRMRGENLGDAAWAALFIGLDALEESDVGVRVVTGFVHVLQT